MLDHLERRATRRFLVVDNHHVNNTIFAVIGTDGVTSLPPRVWSLVSDVRDAVLQAIEELAPHEWSYVFTNVLVEGDAGDAAFLQRLTEVAARRDSLFVPVRLHCDVEELARRITAPERAARLKWVDSDGLRTWAARHELINLDHPNMLDLDVTELAPEDAAERVLAHVEKLLA